MDAARAADARGALGWSPAALAPGARGCKCAAGLPVLPEGPSAWALLRPAGVVGAALGGRRPAAGESGGVEGRLVLTPRLAAAPRRGLAAAYRASLTLRQPDRRSPADAAALRVRVHDRDLRP